MHGGCNDVNNKNLTPEKIVNYRSSRLEVFCKKGVIKNVAKFTGKDQCQSHFLIQLQALASQFIKKETLAQVFFCDICEISIKNLLKP